MVLKMMDANAFNEFIQENIRRVGEDKDFLGLSRIWVRESIRHQYAQNFSWMGRPVIQVPQDIYAIQELVWECKPDLIVETGIARGGSLVLSASLLALLDYSEASVSGKVLNPRDSHRKVLGVDIDIRKHNREAIMSHPLSHMIQMVQGSSVDHDIIGKVYEAAKGHSRVMVFLDSNHTHEHVLAELVAYAPLVSRGSYCVVWDTGIDDLPDGFITDRPWGRGNNPKTAVFDYLARVSKGDASDIYGEPMRFEIDKVIEHKIVITASADGFLKRL
jgi:cephalosporin hydroxylase